MMHGQANIVFRWMAVCLNPSRIKNIGLRLVLGTFDRTTVHLLHCTASATLIDAFAQYVSCGSAALCFCISSRMGPF